MLKINFSLHAKNNNKQYVYIMKFTKDIKISNNYRVQNGKKRLNDIKNQTCE